MSGDEYAAKIARELEDREFYGLANTRIGWLLAERERLSATLARTKRYAEQGRIAAVRQEIARSIGD